jgi:hypothetical protein
MEPHPHVGEPTMTDAQALRHQLRDAGYCPIPLYGKEPPIYGKNNKRGGLKAWQELHEVTADQIDMWGKTWPNASNTGVLTFDMPTLDLDILDEAAACACEDFVRDSLRRRRTRPRPSSPQNSRSILTPHSQAVAAHPQSGSLVKLSSLEARDLASSSFAMNT